MAKTRKDCKGRTLRTGESYDPKNKRYIFKKMVNGERITITAHELEDLRKQENEIIQTLDKGGKLNRNSQMSLNEYFDFWLETFAKSGRKATTCTNYKSYYETNVRNTIGKKRISSITKVDCQKLINDMADNGKAHSTMWNLKSCLNVIFECAVDDDVCIKNPAKNIQIPQTDKKEKRAIEQEQLELFLRYVKDSKNYSVHYPMFVTMFNTGMRVGELAAITWEDIDFKENTITISKTVNRYRKKDYGFTVAVSSPKSRTSCRVISMNSIVKKELLKLKMQTMVSDTELPFVDDRGRIKGKITGFVFVTLAGTPWVEPTFRDLIDRIIERQNIEAEANDTEKVDYFCPHEARHTYTSLAYSAGMDVKAVSEILGHASTSVTLDTYTHLTQNKRKEQEAVVQAIKIS